MCLYSWVYSFGIHKPYALQDTGYTKMNEHIFKEQVILMLKDKERYPICLQEGMKRIIYREMKSR